MSEIQIEEQPFCFNAGLNQNELNSPFCSQNLEQELCQRQSSQVSLCFQSISQQDNTREKNQACSFECPSINFSNNFYNNLEQIMFSDDANDHSSSSSNTLNNSNIFNLKKESNPSFRKQSSFNLDKKLNSSQNFDNSIQKLRKFESDDCKNQLPYGFATTTNANTELCLSNQNSFSSALSTPFSRNSKKNNNATFSAYSQDSSLGYERFIPTRKNNKMFINFQNKDSSDMQKKSSQTKSDSQTPSNSQNNNESLSIASLYQKHILDTSDNSKILSFNGNRQQNNNSSFMSQQKPGLYSQQSIMEQENINDEDFFRSNGQLPSQSSLSFKKKQSLVITDSTKILDAPGLEDDYYLNLLHWSAQNVISIVLKNEVFGYNYSNKKIFSMQKPDKNNIYKFTSVKFSKSGQLLAIGDSLGGLQIIDAETRREVAFFQNHDDRVASLSWINDEILASGSKDRNIYCHDIRDKNIVRKYQGHRNEVCGLEWSCDQQTLASGGNDDKLFVWNIGYNQHQYKFSQHKAAVKAITWSPHQHGLLVSGGGSRDKTIRFWNIHTGKEVDCIETSSQVCSLAFTKNTNQFVSTHGYADNEIYVWKYPNPQKVKIFQGHQQRVIYMALSPDQKQIVTGASDETLRFWDAFPDAPSFKGPESTLKFSDLR
ncbi:hypothetical protein ABPG74_000314 [Tetrahymena malaccensis]